MRAEWSLLAARSIIVSSWAPSVTAASATIAGFGATSLVTWRWFLVEARRGAVGLRAKSEIVVGSVAERVALIAKAIRRRSCAVVAWWCACIHCEDAAFALEWREKMRRRIRVEAMTELSCHAGKGL